MDNVKCEIKRVEYAIINTNSKYLKNDYEKCLKKLYRKLEKGECYGSK